MNRPHEENAQIKGASNWLEGGTAVVLRKL